MKMLSRLLLSLFSLLLVSTMAGAATVAYDLDIAWQDITIHTKKAKGMTINGGIPGPTLYFTEGDLARIRVHNSMDIRLSFQMISAT